MAHSRLPTIGILGLVVFILWGCFPTRQEDLDNRLNSAIPGLQSKNLGVAVFRINFMPQGEKCFSNYYIAQKTGDSENPFRMVYSNEPHRNFSHFHPLFDFYVLPPGEYHVVDYSCTWTIPVNSKKNIRKTLYLSEENVAGKYAIEKIATALTSEKYTKSFAKFTVNGGEITIAGHLKAYTTNDNMVLLRVEDLSKETYEAANSYATSFEGKVTKNHMILLKSEER